MQGIQNVFILNLIDMKFKTQKSAILFALLQGSWLSPMDCFKNFGCTKIATRVGEYQIEFGFTVEKEQVDFNTRYGTSGQYKKYRFNPKNNPVAASKIKEWLILQGETIVQYSQNMEVIKKREPIQTISLLIQKYLFQ